MGAGADVTACIYLPTVMSPMTFNFTPHKDACMDHGGIPASVVVKDAGITSVSVGYVESKVSGFKCLSAPSYWTLAYNVDGSSYSGSVRTQWMCPPENNSITLDNPGTTTVNTAPARSTVTHQEWHGRGSLFIIFSPATADLLAATDST